MKSTADKFASNRLNVILLLEATFPSVATPAVRSKMNEKSPLTLPTTSGQDAGSASRKLQKPTSLDRLRQVLRGMLWTLLLLLVLNTLVASDWDNESEDKARKTSIKLRKGSQQADDSAQCPVQPVLLTKGNDWKPQENETYRGIAAENLRGAIRIPTESFDTMGEPGEDSRFEQMGKLHSYFEETFPLVHSGKVRLEKVAIYGLLYTWKGTKADEKPIVLMAHQDVVPVNKDTEDRWTYPPFSAHMDEMGWIWGRGGADCKNTLVGILAAMEQLLSEGYTPERTIILSSGFDEEIGGPRSAAPLAALLLDRYGSDGVAFILDEGFTGVDKAYGNTRFARLGMTEKGAFSLILSVSTTGGHSSVPSKHTGIGLLSLLLVALENNPMRPILRKGNPVLSFLNCAADYSDNMDSKLKKRVRNKKEWRSLGEDMAKGDDVMRAFLSTTQAIDLIKGGDKVNALPEHATATINYRIDFLESVNSTFSRISSILRPIVTKQLNMTFSENGSHADVKTNVVSLDISGGSSIEPAPITPGSGGAWDLIGGTVKGVFGEDTVVAPSAMIANTDTKWSWMQKGGALTQNIYRFVPASLELVKDFHTVDERIHIDAHLTSVQFFYKLIRNTEGWME